MSDKKFKDFHIIKDNKLDTEYFLSILEKIEWKKAPRKLNQDIHDYWYIGDLDVGNSVDAELHTIFKFKVSPDKWMRAMETHVGEFIGNRGERKNRSTSIEINVGQKLIDKIKELAVEYCKEKTQLVDL